MSALPDTLPPALAAGRPVATVAHVIDLAGVLRLALSPSEVAPLLGLEPAQVRDLCRNGLLRCRNLHPGSRNGRYVIPVGALVEWLSGHDERDDL